MEPTEKLNSTKAVLSYLIELFPQCFVKEGEAKPLKIGIFQDIADRIKDDDKVSKTQVRAALRQYTSSWRYLYGVKPGAKRVDLDGNEVGLVEQEHIDHAKEALELSKAKVRAHRKEMAAKKNATEKQERRKNKTVKTSNYTKKNEEVKVQKPSVISRPLKAEEVAENLDVKVNMGKGDLPATIIEVQKGNNIKVRLVNGLSISVSLDNLRL